MRKSISVILLLLCSLTSFAASGANDDYQALSPEDQQLLGKLVGLVDMGLSEGVMPDFDYLAKKYPDNYLVQYERAYNLYMLKRYDEMIKLRKFLLKHKSADEQTYQLIGNAYDDSGERNEAIKVYEEGLKRFPGSGSLCLELGTVYNMEENYDKALEYYNRGILAEPNFASNYYRAAQLYLASDAGKVWGLMYAESAVLLAPSKDDRHEEMAAMMVECFKGSISLNLGDSTELSVKFVPGRDIKIDSETHGVYLGFQGIYEGALGRPLMKLVLEKQAFTCSLSQLIDIRKGAVESYFDVTDNLYGNSMYLLEFQKKIIDAGHWDAYNYFLFMLSFPDEFAEWYEENRAALDAFVEWYNSNPYMLGDGRSVDPMQIYDNYRPLTLPEALQIQARLLTDGNFEKQGE